MAAVRHCLSWADLPSELLGLVLRRLPSLADRVRLAAVCRPWRHSARLEPVLPPPFPWLTLRDGTFLSILDGKVYCLPSVPPDNSPCLGSVGNWLFLEQRTGDRGSKLLSLMNPFSKDVMQLPDADTIWRHEPINGYHNPCILAKLVLLDGDLSPDSLFAVLAIAGGMLDSGVVSICQPSTDSAFRVLNHENIFDIEFVDGKLYALSHKKLFVLDLESSGKCKPKISSMKCIADDVVQQTVAGEKRTCGYLSYLAKSRGKLLHVTRLVGRYVLPGENRVKFCRTFSILVFEVDFTTSSSVQWRRLTSLEGEALFVGPYSKALHASQCGAQADCIYFMCDYGWKDCPDNPFRDSGVFNITNGTITPLLPETMIMRMPGGTAKGHSPDKFYPARPSWFFPC